MDADNRIHNPDGPAILYRDGFAVYAWHGLRLPTDGHWIIKEPSRMTATSILDERNAEIRRVMLEKFGQARFVSELGAEPVASDDFGQLYSVDIPGDELLVMVRVENSTPDPDGSRREYWLRVDPDAYGGDAARVPQAAVASTWRYADGALVYRRYGDYRPVVET